MVAVYGEHHAKVMDIESQGKQHVTLTVPHLILVLTVSMNLMSAV